MSKGMFCRCHSFVLVPVEAERDHMSQRVLLDKAELVYVGYCMYTSCVTGHTDCVSTASSKFQYLRVHSGTKC